MAQAIVPGSNVKIQGPTGGASTEYLRFFNALPGVGKPAALVTVTPTGSPFQYAASAVGTLMLSGGTVSARTLTRNNVLAPMGASAIPVSNGDIVTITYTVAPTITFIPS